VALSTRNFTVHPPITNRSLAASARFSSRPDNVPVVAMDSCPKASWICSSGLPAVKASLAKVRLRSCGREGNAHSLREPLHHQENCLRRNSLPYGAIALHHPEQFPFLDAGGRGPLIDGNLGAMTALGAGADAGRPCAGCRRAPSGSLPTAPVPDVRAAASARCRPQPRSTPFPCHAGVAAVAVARQRGLTVADEEAAQT
jgi:hypothetical protein